jgi:uncharacterized protein YciI
MKAVLIGEPAGKSREEIMPQIMAAYPSHKALVDELVARGAVIGIGPFSDFGNMAIFRTRADAEEFARRDPFILQGLVKSFVIRDWNDELLT